MNQSPICECEDLRKQHSANFTLCIESLTLNAGDVLCLVGPTGSGKSTLLRLLSGLDRPTSGSLSLLGQPIWSNALTLELQRQVVVVPQKPLLLADSVRYNVEFGLRVRGDRDARVRSDAMLAKFGLSRFANQPARTLSGGQMQLVAIARALVLEPSVLLLDEPTAHLDPAHVALVEQVVLDEWRRTGMSLAWATHNLFQARRVATRVGLMLEGRMIEITSTEQFFASPRDVRTSHFVQGKMVY
ncbi:MAG: ATP-binding cassette domain-containing protein [Pirellulales bacterium]